MFFVRPLLRALANALAWFAALWGFQVTADLELLIGLALLVGVLNFALAVYDERRVEGERKLVKELRDFMRATMGPMEIPPHLQDLSRLTNRQLKGLAGQYSNKLREFGIKWRTGRMKSAWLPDRAETFEERSERLQEESTQERVEFERELMPDTKATWDELARRVELLPEERSEARNMLEFGSLAGVNPAGEFAAIMEGVVRRLPDE